MLDNIESLLNGKSTFAESSLGHLLDKPLDAAFLPRKLRAFPKELADKFGLPQELCLLAILSFASAHMGQSVRMGNNGEWSLGIGNLRFAVGLDRTIDLNPIFRTLGMRLFRGEKHGFWTYRQNTGKAPTIDEEARFINMGRQTIKNQEIELSQRLATAALQMEKFNGRARPNYFLDDATPEQWGEIVGESSGEALFALGSRGVSVRKFLDGTLDSRQREIFLHVLRAGWLEESFKARTGRRSWAFAGQISVGVLWALPSPLLRSALGCEQMKTERLWDDFLITEIEIEDGVPKIRPGTSLPSLSFWEERMRAFHPIRVTGNGFKLGVQECAAKSFDDFADKLTAILPQLPPEAQSFVLGWPTTAHKIACILSLLEHGFHEFPIIEDTAVNACNLVSHLGARTLHTLENAVNSQRILDDLEAERTMARKLKSKGPVSFQTLRRSYRKQAKRLHEPVLESLKRKGVVTLGEDKLIRFVA